MEKLQKALQKARETREGGPSLVNPDRIAGNRIPPVAADPALPRSDGGRAWEELTPIDLDPHHLTRNRIFALSAGREATQFDILRTKAQLIMRKNGWTRLAVTSPTPTCGKTTIACNLAAGLSRQPDIRAVVIELDLHRPTMAAVLGFAPPADVTSMLSGRVGFAEQAVRLRDNVAISAARRSSGDPTAVLLNRRTHETLAEIERVYRPNLMIFDLPPLLTSDDTRAFLHDVDCAMMVVRAETSTVGQIDTCEREIAEHTNFLGIVLNQCRHADENSGYYGYGADAAEGRSAEP